MPSPIITNTKFKISRGHKNTDISILSPTRNVSSHIKENLNNVDQQFKVSDYSSYINKISFLKAELKKSEIAY